MKQILFKRSLILLAILWGSVGVSNSQTSVNINFFFDSTWTVSCPTPAVIDFNSYGTATGYDPATDSIDIYISFGDGSDTTFTVPIGSFADFSFWLQHTYSLAGTYMTNMIATAPDGASDTLTHGPIYIYDDCATITGATYLDNNSNCIFDAGDDIDHLMTLCDADITSKNPNKVKKYLANFQLVRKKLKIVEEKDRVRNFQPPINGNEIMQIFNISSGKEIGQLKKLIKDAILDGVVENNKEDALTFLTDKAKELNIKKRNEI